MEILKMRDDLYGKEIYGPFVIAMSRDWKEYVDGDIVLHETAGPVTTLREYLKLTEGILDVRIVKSLSDFDVKLCWYMDGMLLPAEERRKCL
jgi:hypothetical protein